MATGWMKSLQCKSKALDDVVEHSSLLRPKNHHHSTTSPSSSLSQSSSCRNSVQSLKDIVETTKQSSKPKKPKPPFKRPVARKPEPGSHPPPAIRTRPISSESFFPSLTQLPEGHPSRNVVEIIFHTSWGEKSFAGQIEMVFKVQNLTRTVTRFEEYREMVKSRVSSTGDCGEDQARCIADGNEVMRFYCLGPTANDGAYEAGCGAWALYGGKGSAAAVCTYSGSGCAHENAGGGRGRRAMLVCRVIAGRVRKQIRFDSLLDSRVGYDSMSGENGELLVFDTRALLPCFLIIYKL
ncbi:hypothetical protein BUALT_Bualt05G0073900 [Buddleja alternifolia]|uniref:Uncharacterized protein n=1 Tax=Buddleja alternifolia TaxID=168488 RepID=A0AAV6XT75_9LAMI|nr:hypothetical protein BUALT_Bualt05G0073900 [Buddleja alternifolia]